MAEPWLIDLGNNHLLIFKKKEKIWAQKIPLLLGKSTMDNEYYLSSDAKFLISFQFVPGKEMPSLERKTNFIAACPQFTCKVRKRFD